MKPVIRLTYSVLKPVNTFLAILFAMVTVVDSFGQNYNHPVSGFQTVELGEGTYNYYDNGGPNGNYSNNINSWINFVPDDGHFMTWQVITYNIEDGSVSCGGSCCDLLTASFIPGCGDILLSESFCGTGQEFSPRYLCAGESLEFYFSSDGSITPSGWHIRIEVFPNDPEHILCHPESNCYDNAVGGFLECSPTPFPQEFSCWGFGPCPGVINNYPGCTSEDYPGIERIYGFNLDETSNVTVSCDCIQAAFIVDG